MAEMKKQATPTAGRPPMGPGGPGPRGMRGPGGKPKNTKPEQPYSAFQKHPAYNRTRKH
jgi:hypothetical protein